MTGRSHAVAALLLLALLGWTNAAGQADVVRISLNADWLRRDDARCRSGVVLTAADTLLSIRADTSFALFWQIPLASANPLRIDRSAGWVRTCRRPPLDFGATVREALRGRPLLVNAATHRYLTWEWRVSHTLADSGSSRAVDRRYAARLGVNIVRKGSSTIRELAYLWARTQPTDHGFTHKAAAIPGMALNVQRLVVRSGVDSLGSWVSQRRDLLADYRRFHPREEPGEILRVYVRAESEAPETPVTVEFRNIRLASSP